ncbi:hypothetical protein HaLaN_27614, partial [Haematococcus lacustris]
MATRFFRTAEHLINAMDKSVMRAPPAQTAEDLGVPRTVPDASRTQEAVASTAQQDDKEGVPPAAGTAGFVYAAAPSPFAPNRDVLPLLPPSSSRTYTG